MAVITPQAVNRNAAIEPTYNVVEATGDLIANSGGDTVIHVKNGGASPTTVSANATKSCDAGQLHNFSLVVPAGEEKVQLLNSRLNNSSGQVPLSYTESTSVTIFAYTVKD